MTSFSLQFLSSWISLVQVSSDISSHGTEPPGIDGDGTRWAGHEAIVIPWSYIVNPCEPYIVAENHRVTGVFHP